MMRTPAKSVVRNANQIGKTPTPTKACRHPLKALFSRQISTSHQMASILYNRASMSPVQRVQLQNVLKKKQIDENIVASDASVEKDVDNILATVEDCSSDDNFITRFTGWLVKTNGKIDAFTFSRIKDDLCQIVGKYELEFAENK